MHNCSFKINLVDFLVVTYLDTIFVTVIALVCDMMGTIAVAGFTVAVQIVTTQTAFYESRKQVYLLCLIAGISPLAGLHRPSNLVKGLCADDCIKCTLYTNDFAVIFQFAVVPLAHAIVGTPLIIDICASVLFVQEHIADACTLERFARLVAESSFVQFLGNAVVPIPLKHIPVKNHLHHGCFIGI